MMRDSIIEDIIIAEEITHIEQIWNVKILRKKGKFMLMPSTHGRKNGAYVCLNGTEYCFHVGTSTWVKTKISRNK